MKIKVAKWGTPKKKLCRKYQKFKRLYFGTWQVATKQWHSFQVQKMKILNLKNPSKMQSELI